MGKILKIENDIVTVGNDDGSLSEVRIDDCNFNPNVGDEVNIFASETKTVCVKAEAKKEEVKSDVADMIKNGGININLTQNQGSNNIGAVPESPYYNVGGKHAVNKLPYVLFAILLGNIGVHKFYAGKTGQGILYLLFCWTWIPWIIGLVEGIIAACQKEDSNGRILV